MKNWTVAKWSLGLALAALPLIGGCVQESANSAPAVVSATNQNLADNPSAVAEAPVPEATEANLENAPGKIVSLAEPPVQTANLTPSAAEVARLAQSGLEENVMLAFVSKSASAFNLGSDQIIYLNDIGVPGSVVTAMIQRDQALRPWSPVPVAPQPTVANSPLPAAVPETVASQPLPVLADSAPAQAAVSSTYFQDSLSPYGNWIELEGYGLCWQPSVVVANRSWSPYCNGGRWVYSDCGWYWASDYSWGWAPFHYGRWFRHGFWGWCWAPDTVWGPAWVSWRYNSGYCGWAPLAPAAFFLKGSGFTGIGRGGFTFRDRFTFVPADRFCDPHPFQHRLPPSRVTQIFDATISINPTVEERDHGRFHKGIPVERIAEATHTDIQAVRIRETSIVPRNGRGEQFDRNNGALTVFRPRLPEPAADRSSTRLGEGANLAAPDNEGLHRSGTDTAMHKGIPQHSSGVINASPSDRVNHNVPVFKAPALSPKPGDPRPGSLAEGVRIGPALGNSQPRNPRELDNPSASSNRKDIPPNSLIMRGRPDTTAQAKLDSAAPSVIQPPLTRNNLLLNRWQQQYPVPQPQTEAPGRYPSSDGSALIHSAAPPQSQPDARPYQAPQATPREQRGSFNPVPERSGQAIHAQTAAPPPAAARVEAPPVEMRQAPAARAPQPSAQGDRNNVRQNR